MSDRKMMKDLNLNDTVTIEMPAHLWVAAMSAYAEAEWDNIPMNFIFRKVQEALLDPVYMREEEAANQQRQSAQQKLFHTLTGEGHPEVPPNAGDLS